MAGGDLGATEPKLQRFNGFMHHIAARSLVVALGVSTIMLLTVVGITVTLELRPPPPNHLPLLKFELAMFKVVLAGFVVGMLGILIPAVVSETHHRFQQRKESRIAYSKAKTEIDYLKLHLAAAKFSKAADLLKSAHFRKHQAELYEDFPEWVFKRSGDEMDPEQWDIKMYGRLFGARKVLEANAARWDELRPQERIELLKGVLPTIDERKLADRVAEIPPSGEPGAGGGS